MQTATAEPATLLPLVRVQGRLFRRVLALYDEEFVTGLSWLAPKFREGDFSADGARLLSAKLSRARRVRLSDVTGVNLIRPHTGFFGDRNWRVVLYSRESRHRLVFEEEGQNVLRYFQERMPERVRVLEGVGPHFWWRLRDAYVGYGVAALVLLAACLALAPFVSHEVTALLLVLLLAACFLIGLFVVPLSAVPKDTSNYRPQRVLLPRLSPELSGKKGRHPPAPSRAPVLGLLVKVVAVVWFLVCFFWVDLPSGMAGTYLYLLLNLPTVLLLRWG
ncbi:MAG TPA: hypothetical protein VF521_05950, partial [Pyrinomonadaceae bacterium]